jgi:hypothetical protein
MAAHNLSPAKLLAHNEGLNLDDLAAAAVAAAVADIADIGGTEALAFTGVTNIDTVVIVGVCHFQRVDDTVVVSGRVTIDPTAGAATEFGIALVTGHLIANIAAATEVHGIMVAANGDSGVISGDATNERATVNYTSTDGTATVGYFIFTYEAD